MAVKPISISRQNGRRFLITVGPIVIAMVAAVGLVVFYPPIKEAVLLGMKQGRPLFTWLVVLPSIVMAVVTTVLAFKMLWSASAPRTQSGSDAD